MVSQDPQVPGLVHSSALLRPAAERGSVGCAPQGHPVCQALEAQRTKSGEVSLCAEKCSKGPADSRQLQAEGSVSPSRPHRADCWPPRLHLVHSSHLVDGMGLFWLPSDGEFGGTGPHLGVHSAWLWVLGADQPHTHSGLHSVAKTIISVPQLGHIIRTIFRFFLRPVPNSVLIPFLFDLYIPMHSGCFYTLRFP